MKRKTKGQKPTENNITHNIDARRLLAGRKLAAGFERPASVPKSVPSSTDQTDVSVLKIRADLPILIPEHLHGLVEACNRRIQACLSRTRKGCPPWLPSGEVERRFRSECDMEMRWELAALEAAGANNQGGAQ